MWDKSACNGGWQGMQGAQAAKGALAAWLCEGVHAAWCFWEDCMQLGACCWAHRSLPKS